MSLLNIMDELALILEDLPQIEQSVGRLNENPTPPCIDIYPGDPFDSQDEAGFQQADGSYVFTVRGRVNTADHEAGQDTLLGWMDFLSSSSVDALLEDDQSLNGYASSVVVQACSGFRHYIDANGQQAHLGCEWRVKVLPVTS